MLSVKAGFNYRHCAGGIGRRKNEDWMSPAAKLCLVGIRTQGG